MNLYLPKWQTAENSHKMANKALKKTHACTNPNLLEEVAPNAGLSALLADVLSFPFAIGYRVLLKSKQPIAFSLDKAHPSVNGAGRPERRPGSGRTREVPLRAG